MSSWDFLQAWISLICGEVYFVIMEKGINQSVIEAIRPRNDGRREEGAVEYVMCVRNKLI